MNFNSGCEGGGTPCRPEWIREGGEGTEDPDIHHEQVRDVSGKVKRDKSEIMAIENPDDHALPPPRPENRDQLEAKPLPRYLLRGPPRLLLRSSLLR